MKYIGLIICFSLSACSSIKFREGDCVQIENNETVKIISICSHYSPANDRAGVELNEKWKYEIQDLETKKYAKYSMDYVDKFEKVSCK